MAEHEICIANEYVNLLAFSYLLAEKTSCSADLSMKKVGSAELSMKNFYNLGVRITYNQLQRKKTQKRAATRLRKETPKPPH